MIAIIDYGVGNLFSLQSSFRAIGVAAEVTSDEKKISDADRILLPGVGAFINAAEKLRHTRLDRIVVREAEKGKPLLGICLGMQLLCEKSYEFGECRGLGLLKGDVRYIGDVIEKNLRIPHIGWNALNLTKDSPLFRHVSDGDHVYFVHSYYAANCKDSVIATADYSVPLTAAVQKKNIFGCQFHPEKSGRVGLEILRAFAELKEVDIC